MKKTLLALTVAALTAGSAQAITIYEKDGSNLDLYGRFGAMFDKSEKSNTDLKDDESRIGLKVSHQITNELSALGGLEFRFSDSERRFTDPTTHDAYAGLKHTTYGTLTLGRQATTADDLALSKFAYSKENITTLPKNGDRTIKYRSADFGGLSFGVDHTFMGTNDKDVDVRSSSTGAGLFYNTQIGEVGVKVNGGYAYTQYDTDEYNQTFGATNTATTNKDKYKRNDWMVGTQLAYQDTTLGIDYAHGQMQYKNPIAESDKLKINRFQVALRQQFTPELGGFTAYQFGKAKLADLRHDTYHQYTLGVDYKLHKNVITYAQLDIAKAKDKIADESNSDVGGAIGLRVLF